MARLPPKKIPAPTPGRYPTTAHHGDFWLLSFPPGPVRPSLANLNTPGSPSAPMLMASLVRTSSQRERTEPRTPRLKPSTTPDLQVAGLQERATTPSRETSAMFATSSLLTVSRPFTY
ncbi:Proteasome subunit alpha type-4 [Homalodisca vitripennis]|nr:Proteasome subunit alpha type-4 [Homalodisca vitripennis]